MALSCEYAQSALVLKALRDCECPLMVDSVEKVGCSFVVNDCRLSDELAWWGSRGRRCGHRDQLGHFAKVLSGCSEDELVACAVRPS